MSYIVPCWSKSQIKEKEGEFVDHELLTPQRKGDNRHIVRYGYRIGLLFAVEVGSSLIEDTGAGAVKSKLFQGHL